MKDHLFGVAGEWQLVQCGSSHCGLVWQNPMLMLEDIPLAYRTYYTHAKEGDFTTPTAPLDTPPASESPRTVKQRVADFLGIMRAKKQLAQMYLEKVVPGRLLDVGCGDGGFLVRMRKFGWQVEGTDFDPVAVEGARRRHGLKIHLGDLGKLQLPGNSFTAVTMSHVIEHVPFPLELLRECHRLLKPGGHLVMSTPNSQSLGARYLRDNWLGWDQPRHLHIFSQANIAAVLKQAAFTDVQTWTTAANAGYVLDASLTIRREGHFDMRHSTSAWRSPRLSRALQAAETLLIKAGAVNAGEELIAHCQKGE